jgi:hypothetical protein
MEKDNSTNVVSLDESDLAPISEFKEKRNVRDWPGMVIGAAMRWRVEKGLSYAQNPKNVELPPDDWFRNDDPQEFKDEVSNEIIRQMEKAKPHLVQILDQTVRGIHTGVKESPTVQSVQEKLGKDSFRLARQLTRYVELLKGKLPERVTPELLEKIAETAKGAAHVLNTWMTDEREVATIENAIREFAGRGVVDEETWDSIKDLSGPEFVTELFKKMGVHIGVQPLNAQELDMVYHKDMKEVVNSILAKIGIKVGETQAPDVKNQQEDVKDVAKFMLGVSGGDVLDRDELNQPSTTKNTTQRRRTLGTLQPLIYITADKGLFPGKSSEEQLKLMYRLQDRTKGQYFGTLGAFMALDLAQRSATLRPQEVSEKIGQTPIRLICQDNFSGGQTFVDISYDRSNGHENRTLKRSKDKIAKACKGVGIAWGEEFSIDEK